MFKFQAYGLTICSDLMLAQYSPVLEPPSNAVADVCITYGDVSPSGFEDAIERGLFYQVKANGLWLNVPNIGRFWVDGGRRIIIEPEKEIDEASLAVLVSGPCLAALLMQRDFLVLNGSVLKMDDHAVAFIGQNSSGKSLLLAAMMQRGYKMLADDLCIVRKDGMVFPGLNQINLWSEAVDFLNINVKELQAIRPQIKKYRWVAEDAFYAKPLPLKTVYTLTLQQKEMFHAKHLTGGEKINVLQKNFYNKLYLSGMRKNNLYFNYCAMLANRIGIVLIEYNRMHVHLQDFIDLLEKSQVNKHDI
ncbi:hypothetical protein [Legionella oakridgensis]|uniref:Serine kinase of the HPr protein, regulates carbohydrate metabolism n=2 Tax=Legionella oakridgensis TaxID=29423 RepID=W0BFU4_9GAMM|nr:hypothetical protein [Legionella oakridgensis]AHE67571.1 hypothetical protein Loa_02027 [Legionella oakridgensis ATCC 33761 = DSM 21215]ETO92816.1 hypothetical protein LOR_61c14700 [Legionella oakridgensis RV-2-2007]KTD37078.1 hypothetical protein Loak_2214 [Legionella oakridgensis]STY20613.1 HPr kinase [Legionella longbeachae]